MDQNHTQKPRKKIYTTIERPLKAALHSSSAEFNTSLHRRCVCPLFQSPKHIFQSNISQSRIQNTKPRQKTARSNTTQKTDALGLFSWFSICRVWQSCLKKWLAVGAGLLETGCFLFLPACEAIGVFLFFRWRVLCCPLGVGYMLVGGWSHLKSFTCVFWGCFGWFSGVSSRSCGVSWLNTVLDSVVTSSKHETLLCCLLMLCLLEACYIAVYF